MQQFVQWWESLGWLANLLGVVLPVLGFIGVAWRFWRWATRSRFASLIPRNFTGSWTVDRSRPLARIAIVDDQPQDFPVAELKAGGYLVTVYRQATLGATAQLAAYDIIFLDMKGIVKDDHDQGGLKLIQELRQINPSQKICAVSSKTFDPTATAFFRQADDVRRKPLTAQECRGVIDKFLLELFGASALIPQVRSALSSQSFSARAKIVSALRASIESGKVGDDFRTSLNEYPLGQGDRVAIYNLGRVLLHARQ